MPPPGHSRKRRVFALIGAALLWAAPGASLAALAIKDAPVSLQQTWNPDPDPLDIVLPMPCGLSMAFRAVAVPGGPGEEHPFTMGVADLEKERRIFGVRREGRIAGVFTPQDLPIAWRTLLEKSEWHGHTVYLLGKYEVSQAQWDAVMRDACPVPEPPRPGITARVLGKLFGEKPTQPAPGAELPASAALPAREISWADMQTFLGKYNQWLQEQPHALPRFVDNPKKTGFVRLPTEAEWEFAARGGLALPVGERDKDFPFPGDKTDHAVFAGKKRFERPEPIGSRRPNPLGLYDTAGNVKELMDELFRVGGSSGGVVVKGGGFRSGPGEIVPGWRDEANRYNKPGDQGFRLVLTGELTASARRMETLNAEEKQAPVPHAAVEKTRQETETRVRAAREQQLAAEEEARRAKSELERVRLEAAEAARSAAERASAADERARAAQRELERLRQASGQASAVRQPPQTTTAAQGRTPLLQPGKAGLFQRVLTHPGAQLYAGPAGSQSLGPVKTFTAMYIYGRQGSRLEVGPGSDGPRGWMDANTVTEWPQAITMVFTDRAGRAPVLFFRDRRSLETTCQAASVSDTVRGYAEQLAQSADQPVIATEPAATAVSERNFYLMPVLNIDSRYRGLNMVEVAAIDPGLSPGTASAGPAPTGPGSQTELRTGFAFVIDAATISMQPYIDQTLHLVRRLYDALEKSPHGDKTAFAVVAFRGGKTSGDEYAAQTICDFTTVKDRGRLENALARLKAAQEPVRALNHDAFAGIKEAVDRLSWQDYGSRLMLMISDSGPLGADDPDSATGFSPKAMADYLHTHNIYLTALHIKNPATTRNHKYAAEAYRTTARQSDNMTSYIAIDEARSGAGASTFARVGATLADSYAKMVAATAEGRLLDTPKQVSAAKLSPEDEARRIAENIGYAMPLLFMGNRQGSTAPQVVRAWIADADLEKLKHNANAASALAVEPAVLVTKSQLHNLRRQLKLILQGGKAALANNSNDLFGHIRAAAAQMSLDPNHFAPHSDRNIADNGLLDEVLADLPYKSQVSGLTQKDWANMGVRERDAFNRRLESLIARYEEYDRDHVHWESFGATNPNDAVYRVPLSMLP